MFHNCNCSVTVHLYYLILYLFLHKYQMDYNDRIFWPPHHWCCRCCSMCWVKDLLYQLFLLAAKQSVLRIQLFTHKLTVLTCSLCYNKINVHKTPYYFHDLWFHSSYANSDLHSTSYIFFRFGLRAVAIWRMGERKAGVTRKYWLIFPIYRSLSFGELAER